ncbi:MAG: transporter [Rudaea sp.]|uniref:transporter n=1 Tax=Rudaea sp. TaxID=2136325 RepID=UPI0039E34AF9
MTFASTFVRIVGFLALLAGAFADAAAEETPLVRQSLDEAWWTGPMLAASAGTLPQGHFLVEPYLYDAISPHADGFGSLTYINYGLTDRLTVGLIPTFGYNRVSGGLDSSHVGVGDVSVQAQWRVTQFDADSGLPTMSVNVQQTLPAGKFDRLGGRSSDGLGGGARTTTLGWYMQTYFWMPNGRILRTRLDIADAFSRGVGIEDVSVYGTAQGFRGRAKPGDVQTADLAFEYSLTRNWVLAMDLLYRHAQNMRIVGHSAPAAAADDVRVDSGPRVSFALAPAVEYNWNARVGMLFGVRRIPRTRAAAATTTPALALNMVF